MYKIILLVFFSVSLYSQNLKHILILHSYHKSMSWVSNIDKAMNDNLKLLGENYVIHTEYMDTKRVFTPEYLKTLKRIYKYKYKDIKFAMILSSDNNAFNFLRKNRNVLFGDIPSVFCGVNYFKDSDLDGLNNFTGAEEKYNSLATIQAALKLNPSINNIFIINDYLTTGKASKKMIQEQLKSLNIKLSYNKNTSIETLTSTLKNLPKNTIVLLGVYYKDKNGKYFTFERIGEIIAQASSVPVFCLYEFYMDKGTVGGSVISGYSQGLAASQMAIDILKGKNIKDILVRKDGATKFIFDYKSLKKFNMDILLLPKTSKIINQPISFYTQHKFVILLSLGIIIFLLVVISILLITIKTKKRIQKKLKKSQIQIEKINKNLEKTIKIRTDELAKKSETFKAIFYGTQEAIAILDFETNFLEINPAYEAMTGFTKEQLLKTSCINLTALKDISASKKAINSIKELGFIKDFTKDCIIKDAKVITINMSMSLLTNPDRILINVKDITNKLEQDKLIIQQSKMIAMGEMIGNIAHQWRQPLSVISTSATGMQVQIEYGINDNKVLVKSCKAINENVQYLSKTIDDFRNYIKGDRKIIAFNLDENINSLIRLVEGTLSNDNIIVIMDLDSSIKIKGYYNELTQCLMNIINNAKDALVEQNIEDKYIFITTTQDNHNAIITIKDNANGISDDIVNKIFDPYFTTKHQDQGTGLGLSMTYKLITDGMNGKINVKNDNYFYKNNKYEGACFMVTIPLSVL